MGSQSPLNGCRQSDGSRQEWQWRLRLVSSKVFLVLLYSLKAKRTDLNAPVSQCALRNSRTRVMYCSKATRRIKWPVFSKYTILIFGCGDATSRTTGSVPGTGKDQACFMIKAGQVTCCKSSAGLSRSEEHTSELQSRLHLVCRLLLEKKKIKTPMYR